MATLAEILAQRDSAIAILQQKVDQANNLRNAGASGMDNLIDDLEEQQAEVAAQAYAAGLDDPTMTEALAALKAATIDMNTVAAKMVSDTTFISNFAGLLGAATKVVSTLKGPG
jgi:hypothetical protein